ncbi:magnesium transporter CorA family protein [Jiella sp. MQZ9-1]|uniref:Magnesium transport protein CorA n=1 Tax=Jiella flava TaxID=2816857 RepID=A0A939JXZ8_9HYPH|nr:magnesium transporter CorA family protein [Jiella flava]MBO0663891.1 magnesium transporter CorA family protein [Jiella flava]MCD2472463.1 magnesium transporter CorA family protein [Jiella flava]
MIESYHFDGTKVVHQAVSAGELSPAAIWIDLQAPTVDEIRAVEALCAIAIPTREEMSEIEVSSRLYSEDGADVMTASVVHGAQKGAPAFAPVTFILAQGRLVTVRYSEPKSFKIFVAKLCRDPATLPPHHDHAEAGEIERIADRPPRAEQLLVGLLEVVVDRMADLLEMISADLDRIGDDIFSSSARKKPTGTGDFKKLLQRIGAAGDLTSRVRESLATLDRLLPFLQLVLDSRKGNGMKEGKARVKVMVRDIHSLNDFVSFLSNKTTFLLDTTVGMISIEQNAIIKIFSVAAVAFLPPTLVASAYGMNFKIMPELEWTYGYPYALVLMVVSALVPLIYFRYKNWL